MSKSLKFCKQAASDPSRSKYSDRNWDDAKEFDSSPIFDQFLHGSRKWDIEGEYEEGTDIHIFFDLYIDPDADFGYFTSSSSIHDGTLLFVRECADRCAYRIIFGQTYDERIDPPKDRDTVHYTVGNLVVLNEYDMDGTKFAPEDKKWMHQRTTALLPIKMWVERENLKDGDDQE